MERGERKLDGAEQAAGGREPQRALRPSPGKVTRTSKLPSSRTPAVHRRAAEPAPRDATQRPRSLWDHTADPWMDAAHRGAAAFEPAVQMQADPAGRAGAQRAITANTIPTREEVHANPRQYGIPPGGNPDDWFNEYVAHTLAYMDPEDLDRNALDPSAPDYRQRLATIERHRATMQGWGYNPDSLTFVNDSRSGDHETGLQAVRVDPLDSDGGIGSIVGFRGTLPDPNDTTPSNPLGVLDDLATDFGRDVGSTQYQPNQERIRALIAGGTGPITLTGHSLGGALSQHAGADNMDLGVANVVGFQAPGIDGTSAAAFDRANADGHVSVRFHEHDNDIVYRAGEQKLHGTHFVCDDTREPDPLDAHLSFFMYDGIDGDGEQVPVVGPGSTVAATTTDPATNRLGWEGARRVAGGLGNMAAAPAQGGFAMGQGLRRAAVNAGTGLRESGRAVADGLADGAVSLGTGLQQGGSQIRRGVGRAAVNAGTGLRNSGRAVRRGVADGAASLGTGVSRGSSQIRHGEVLNGLGTMAGGAGRAVGNVVGGALEGGTRLVGTGARAVGETTGAVMNGLGTMARGAGRAIGDVAGGVWEGTTRLARTGVRAVGETGAAIGDGLATGGAHLVDGIGTAVSGLGNLAEWSVDALGRLVR